MTTAVKHRSYSQINQYRTCGEQYRLERLERVPSRPSAAAVAGRIIHTATETVDHLVWNGALEATPQGWEALCKAGCEAAVEAATEAIADGSKHFPPHEWKMYGRPTAANPTGQNIDWYQRVAIPNAVNAYVDWRVNHPEFTLAEIPDFGAAIEVKFSYFLGDLEVQGFIDRVFTDGTSFYPVDLKSGTKPKTDEQLGLYGAALHEAYGWKPTYGWYLYALKTGLAQSTPALDLSHWTHDKLRAVYLPTNDAIEAGIFIPHPGEACFHCGTRDSCSFARSAI